MCSKRLVFFCLMWLGLLAPLVGVAQEQDSIVTGQDSIITAQVNQLYRQAETEYAKGHYDNTIAILDKAVNLMDSTTVDVQYLLCKSNMDLGRKKQAQKDAHKFLTISTDSLAPHYTEIKNIYLQLESEIGAYNVERDVGNLIDGGFNEQETWDYALRTGTLQAFRNYVKFFPNGVHVPQAEVYIKQEEKKMEEPSKLLVDAVKHGDMKKVRELIEAGADVNYVVTYKRSFKKSMGYSHDLYFETPLYMALYKFDYAMAKYLLENGADPNRFTYRKIYDYKSGGKTRSILESMIIACSENGIHAGKDDRLIEFIDLLLDYGLDINFYKGSPLATAVYYHDKKKYNRYKLIRYLLRKGADPTLPGWNDGSASALSIAKSRGEDHLVEILKSKRYKEIRKKIAKKKQQEVREYLAKLKEENKKKKKAEKEQKQKQKEEEKKKREAEKNSTDTTNP